MLLILLALTGLILLKVTCLQNHTIKHIPKSLHNYKNILKVVLFHIMLVLFEFSTQALMSKCKINILVFTAKL